VAKAAGVSEADALKARAGHGTDPLNAH